MEKTPSEKLKEIKEEVRELFPDVNFPDPIREPVFYGKITKTPVTDRIAVVNRNGGEVFCIASTDYKMLTHEEVIHTIIESIDQLPEYGKPEIKISMLNGGAKMSAHVNFPDVEKPIEVKVGDIIQPSVRVKNSLDTMWQFEMALGGNRLVCSNGMTIFSADKMVQKKHMGTLNTNQVANSFGAMLSDFSQANEIMSKWASITLTHEAMMAVSSDMPFSKAEFGKMLDLPLIGQNTTIRELDKGGNLTAYDLHNAATQFLTHEVRSDIRRVMDEPEIEKAFIKHVR